MTWFKVDDTFHSHPKVLATEPAALGLWVVAGTWSSANLTDGFVPDHVLPRLLEGGAELARKLVSSGLWRRAKGGYQFHDWTDYNPTGAQVREQRAKKAEAGRQGGVASGKSRRGSKQTTKQTRSTVEADASGLVEPPTRPDPLPSLREGGSGDAPRFAHGAVASPESDGHLSSDDSPKIPDWKQLPAYGTPRDPSDTRRASAGAARVRQAHLSVVGARPKAEARDATAALDAAVADLPPLAHPRSAPA